MTDHFKGRQFNQSVITFAVGYYNDILLKVASFKVIHAHNSSFLVTQYTRMKLPGKLCTRATKDQLLKDVPFIDIGAKGLELF